MVRFGLVLALAISFLVEAQTTPEQRFRQFFDDITEEAVDLDPSTPEFHMAAQALIYVGREDLFRNYVERAPFLDHGDECPAIGTLAEFRETLVEEAARTRIVIVNEAHTNARHRLLPGILAEWLVPLGYQYFAAETFLAEGLERRPENAVTVGMGTYSFEPVFGRTLRQIEGMGYAFVAYEMTMEQRPEAEVFQADPVNTRETIQAANLVEFLAEHPEARILIHVGHSHLFEAPQPGYQGRPESRWMANRVRELTGIDPVTISQTQCRSAVGTLVVDGRETRTAGFVDHFIGHPPLEFERNRPTWRREIGDIDTDIPAELLSESERIIVEAHPVGVSPEEVAIDRLMLLPGEDIPLLLPPGRYDLRSYTSEGLLAGPIEVSVGE